MPEMTDPTVSRTQAEVIARPDPAGDARSWIVDRWTFGSTGGPVEHVKTHCERGHWFTPSIESLDPTPTTAEASPIPLSVP